MYSTDQIGRVVGFAVAAARAHQAGKKSTELGEGDTRQELYVGAIWNPKKKVYKGYCARFVRQVYETACRFEEGSWRYAADTALDMCRHLEDAGHSIPQTKMLPGDIIGINRNSGQYGHIAIYVGEIDGKETIAENTSSARRGNPLSPGAKLTPFADIAARVTGVYRLGSIAQDAPEPQDGVKLILTGSTDAKVLTERGQIIGESLYVPAREVCQALGYTVTPHLEQGKVYIAK